MPPRHRVLLHGDGHLHADGHDRLCAGVDVYDDLSLVSAAGGILLHLFIELLSDLGAREMSRRNGRLQLRIMLPDWCVLRTLRRVHASDTVELPACIREYLVWRGYHLYAKSMSRGVLRS